MMREMEKNTLWKRMLTGFLFVMIFAAAAIFTADSAQAATVKISSSKKTVYAGSSFTLTVKNSGSKSVKWSTSNKNVCSIKKVSKTKYTVKALKKGTAIVRAKVGNKTVSCKVTVKAKPYLKSSQYVVVGETVTLTLVNGTSDTKWTSSDDLIVSVMSGGKRRTSARGKSVTICGYDFGGDDGDTATITATCNGKKYTCKVTVGPLLDAGNRADGCYIYKADILSWFDGVGDGSKNEFYRLVYKGQWYDFYELPYETEISLIKKNAYFKNYFENYLYPYQKKISDPTLAGLTAIHHFIYDQKWKYKLEDSNLWNTSQMFIYKKGQCSNFASSFCYLCYISGVDCMPVDVTNHLANAVRYKGYWYYVEPQNFRYKEFTPSFYKTVNGTYYFPFLTDGIIGWEAGYGNILSEEDVYTCNYTKVRSGWGGTGNFQDIPQSRTLEVCPTPITLKDGETLKDIVESKTYLLKGDTPELPAIGDSSWPYSIAAEGAED